MSACRSRPPTPLAPDPCASVHVSHPVVAPDGSQMVFLSDISGSYELFLYEIESGTIDRLTENEAFEGSVSWSPDSRAFAYWAWLEDDTDFEGYRFDLDTRETARIVASNGHDFDLSWSPDGGRIAFQSERTGSRELFLLDLASGSVRRLTANQAEDLTPSWSPDGLHLAFSSDRTGVRQIHTLHLERGTVARLPVQPAGANTFPIWNPQGDRMLVTSEQPDGRHELHRLIPHAGVTERLAPNVSSGPASWSHRDEGLYYSEVWDEGSRIVRLAPGSETPQVVVDCAALTVSLDIEPVNGNHP